MIGWEGADAQTSEMFCTAVVQDVLLYSSDTWVMSPRIWKTLVVFHHRVIQRLTGWMPQCNSDGKYFVVFS